MKVLLLCFLIALVSASTIRRFTSEESRVNKYLIFDDDDTALLVDTGTGDEVETEGIINFIASQGVTNLQKIFITHGHPDHYGGVPGLSEAFPEAKIQVANGRVRNELLNNVAIAMPYSDFDWANTIQVYEDDGILDELDLLMYTDFPEAESEYYAMLYNFDENWIVTGDALSIDIHAYLGAPIDIYALRNWYGITLQMLLPEGSLGLDENTLFYPGHGPAGDYQKVEEYGEYLRTFETLLLSCPDVYFPRSLEGVKRNLILDYPDYEGVNVLDFMVENPAWPAAQAEDDPCAIFDDNYSSLLETSGASTIYFSAILLIALFALL